MMPFLILGILTSFIAFFGLINPFGFFFLTDDFKLYLTIIALFGLLLFSFELVLMLYENYKTKEEKNLSIKLAKDKELVEELETKKELDRFETIYNSLPKDQINCLNNFLNSSNYTLNLNYKSRIVTDLLNNNIISSGGFISREGYGNFNLKKNWLTYLKNKQN